MDRPTHAVADVFRRYGDTYRAQAGAALSTLRQALLEIYVAVVAEAKYNDFGTH